MSSDNIKKGIRAGLWKADAKRADECIKYCPKCKQCYEEMWRHSWQHFKGIKYLMNFPSYGKQKKICVECQDASDSSDERG